MPRPQLAVEFSATPQPGQPAEAKLGTATWHRVTLKGFNQEDDTWDVEEFWGGAPHRLARSEVKPCQEVCPSYGLEPGMRVLCGERKAVTGRRELMEDGRKAWVLMLLGDDVGEEVEEVPEVVVPLESVQPLAMVGVGVGAPHPDPHPLAGVPHPHLGVVGVGFGGGVGGGDGGGRGHGGGVGACVWGVAAAGGSTTASGKAEQAAGAEDYAAVAEVVDV